MALGPLDEACKWALEHSTQGIDSAIATPMLIFNEEMSSNGSTWRQFVVTEVTTLMDNARGRTTPMFYHDIVPAEAPAKLAYDMELDFTDAKKMDKAADAFGTRDVEELRTACDRLLDVLIEETVEALSKVANRPISTPPIRLDGSRAEKWSKHIVFDHSDDTHESIAFAADRDCAEFVERVLASAACAAYKDAYDLVVDRGIYSSRHPLRTYYSAKRGKERLWIRSEAQPDAPCDDQLLVRSLRSCFVSHNTAVDFYHQTTATRFVTSSYLVDEPGALQTESIRICARLRSSLFSSSSSSFLASSSTSVGNIGSSSTSGQAASQLCLAILKCPELNQYLPTVVRFRDPYSMYVRSGALVCADQDGGEHKKGNFCVYLVIDLLRRQYVQLCFSAACIDKRRAQPPRNKALPVSVSDAITDYICSAEWPPGVVVGNDFCTAIGASNPMN